MEESTINRAWQKIGVRQLHGINTPLFSLRSHKSLGVGDFLDLKTLIDWVASIGFNLIQLLPIYDSGWDPSPYHLISANALNPIYLNINWIPEIEKSPEYQELKNLNIEPRLNYEKVRRLKLALLKRHFQQNPIEKEHQLNAPWIDEYARIIGDEMGPDFFRWLQWLAYSQMKEVKEYASAKGILIKGDLPILVSKESVEVRRHPELFNIDLEAGAPPDMYNIEGQHWGFPLYRYDHLQELFIPYWTERLHAAQELFHMYRIDHVVGLFRLWGIPKGKKPVEGYYVPEERSLWAKQGYTILKASLDHSTMMPIAEDLGIIPDETREVLNELGIPGTKVIRWQRDWKGDLHYIPYANYPQNSMTTVSTHDSNLLAHWWVENREEAIAFCQFRGWAYEDTISKDCLFQILLDSHRTPSLLHINLLQEYFSLFPEFRYDHSFEERINIPGTISPLNWTFRYKPFLEELTEHALLNQTMHTFI